MLAARARMRSTGRRAAAASTYAPRAAANKTIGKPSGQFVAQVRDGGVAVGQALGRHDDASAGDRARRHPHRALQAAQP